MMKQKPTPLHPWQEPLPAVPKPALNYPGAVEVIDSILPTLNTILESCNQSR